MCEEVLPVEYSYLRLDTREHFVNIFKEKLNRALIQVLVIMKSE
jgi:hypothetical protein